MEINYSLFTLSHDNEARLSSIVAYLGKRNVVLSHCYSGANVIESRELTYVTIPFSLTSNNICFQPVLGIRLNLVLANVVSSFLYILTSLLELNMFHIFTV
jgi:hypothetical protein